MSRHFTDDDGREWDAAVEFGSYGMLMLMFVPRRGEGIRKAMLASDNSLAAAQEVAGLSEAELKERLAQSVPWDAESFF